MFKSILVLSFLALILVGFAICESTEEAKQEAIPEEVAKQEAIPDEVAKQEAAPDEVACEFKNNDCGIVNQENMGSYFFYSKANIAGREQKMMVLDAKVSKTSGARLITPYYHANGKSFACLVIDFFQNGDGTKTFKIIQQDKTNKTLWTSSLRSLIWQRARMDVNLNNGDPRFFIEATIEPGKEGLFALASLYFTYNKC